MEYLINFATTGFDCGGADVLRVLRFIFILLDIVMFVVPMGLIIILMVDLAKNVIAGKEDEMRKNVAIAFKRVLYCIALFFVDDIALFAVRLVGDMGVNAADTASACIEIARDSEHDLTQYEIDYQNEMNPSNKTEDDDTKVEDSSSSENNTTGNISNSMQQGVNGIGESIIDAAGDIKDKIDTAVDNAVQNNKQ